MGKRSQDKGKWGKRHDTPTTHTLRRWICAECKRQTQLINCADGRKCCPACKAAWERAVLEATTRAVAATITPEAQ